MKKPHRYEIVGSVIMGFDQLGLPVGYIRDLERPIRPPDRLVERR